MSYCRWSSDDFQCDLYVYGSGDDLVTIHVAGRRPDYSEPLPPPVSLADSTFAEWMVRHHAVTEIRKRTEMLPIGLACDGESYDLSYREAAAKVRELIAMGYRCDPSVADALDEDAPAGEAP